MAPRKVPLFYMRDLFGYGRGRKPALDMEIVRHNLISIIEDTNKVIYTVVMNHNNNHDPNVHLIIQVSYYGEVRNISYYVALLLGLKYKERASDYLIVKGGRDTGKWVVQQLQKKLYENMYVKEQLTQKWA